MTRIEIATRIVAGMAATPLQHEFSLERYVTIAYTIADEILKQDAPKKEDGCRWLKDEKRDAYNTQCGHLEDLKQDFKYCPFCGKEIVV